MCLSDQLVCGVGGGGGRRPELTFAARDGVVPVAADAVQAGEGGLPQQGVARQALEGDGHPHAVVPADHHAVAEGPRVRAPLQLVGWRGGGRKVRAQGGHGEEGER